MKELGKNLWIKVGMEYEATYEINFEVIGQRPAETVK